MRQALVVRRRFVAEGKLRFIFYEDIWDCILPGTYRGFGYTPMAAYADWREINIEKGRIENDATKWPLPRPRDDRRGGAGK